MSDYGTKLANLWINKSQKDGREYFSGDFTYGTQIQIWPNRFKREGSKDPDYQMILVEKKKKDEKGSQSDVKAPPIEKEQNGPPDFMDIPF